MWRLSTVNAHFHFFLAPISELLYFCYWFDISWGLFNEKKEHFLKWRHFLFTFDIVSFFTHFTKIKWMSLLPFLCNFRKSLVQAYTVLLERVKYLDFMFQLYQANFIFWYCSLFNSFFRGWPRYPIFWYIY